MNEQDIVAAVEADSWMMEVLRAAATLNLPQWMIGAGFVRSKVWDTLSGHEHKHATDIDLIYFDSADTSVESEQRYAAELKKLIDIDWEVVNQARAHIFDGFPPFTSAADGMAHWTETATSVAVTLDGGELKLIASYGIDDLVNMMVRSCPNVAGAERRMHERVAAKGWLQKWPKLQMITNDEALNI